MSEKKPTWSPPSVFPGDGDSIWVAVLEHDGVNIHVDYAVTWHDIDGLFVHRFESMDRTGELWPPQDVLCWLPCNVPSFETKPQDTP